jgi:hypothetical protein
MPSGAFRTQPMGRAGDTAPPALPALHIWTRDAALALLSAVLWATIVLGVAFRAAGAKRSFLPATQRASSRRRPVGWTTCLPATRCCSCTKAAGWRGSTTCRWTSPSGPRSRPGGCAQQVDHGLRRDESRRGRAAGVRCARRRLQIGAVSTLTCRRRRASRASAVQQGLAAGTGQLGVPASGSLLAIDTEASARPVRAGWCS